MLRNSITGSYYGFIFWNDIMELYDRIIFMKRIPGMPRTSLEPPGIPGIPLARSWAWEPWGRPWEPGHAHGTPIDAHGTPRHAPGTPRDVPETPQGRPWDPRDLQGPLMDHKNNNISTNIQRQKLSIAVFKPACWDPSPEGLSRTFLSITKPPKSKGWRGRPSHGGRRLPIRPQGQGRV